MNTLDHFKRHPIYGFLGSVVAIAGVVATLLQILGITTTLRSGLAVLVCVFALAALFYAVFRFVSRGGTPNSKPASLDLIAETRAVIHDPVKFISSHVYNGPDLLNTLRNSANILWQSGTVDYRGILSNWHWSLRTLFDESPHMTEAFLNGFLHHLIALARGIEELNRAIVYCVPKAALQPSDKENVAKYTTAYNEWLGKLEPLLSKAGMPTESGAWRFVRIPSLSDIIAGVPYR